jgi:hypothetical protein
MNTPAGEVDRKSSDFRAYEIGTRNKTKITPYIEIMKASNFVSEYFG